MASSTKEVKTKSSRRSLKFLQDAPPDASPNIKRAAARYITVEPVGILAYVAFGVLISITPQYLRYAIALEKNVTLPESGGGNGTCVARNRSNPYYVQLQEVQADVAHWQMVIGLSGNLPSLFVCPLLGAWSDIIGRKPVLGIVVAGYVAHALSIFLTSYFMLPIWVIALGSSFSGLTGSLGLLNAQCFAYISDITNEKNRLLRIAVYQSSSVLMLGLGQLGIGYMIRDYGFNPPMLLMTVLFTAALAYVIIPCVLIETVDRNKQLATKREDYLMSSVKAMVKDVKNLFANNVNLRRWRIGLLLLIDFMRELLERSAAVVIVYALGPPFCWSPLNVSNYWMIITFGSAIALTVVTKSISLCLPDLWTLQSSMVFNILYGYVHAFVKTTLGLYMAGMIGCFRNISQALVPAMLAKMVLEDERGVMFAFEASVQNLGGLISPVVLNTIYSQTVQTQPNFVFILIGTAGFIPLITTIILQVINAYTKRRMELYKETGSFDKEELENNGMVLMVEEAKMMDE